MEEEEEETKKKRVLVKLDYGDGLTTEERELKRVQGLAKIKLEKLPKTSKGLFESAVKWEAITEVSPLLFYFVLSLSSSSEVGGRVLTSALSSFFPSRRTSLRRNFSLWFKRS